jgi:predicted Zn-dependent protease
MTVKLTLTYDGDFPKFCRVQRRSSHILPQPGQSEIGWKIDDVKMKKHFGLLLICAVLVTACATSPTGRRQLMLVSEDSAIAASKEAYVQMLQPYADKGKIDNDAALKNRVANIAGRLIAQAIIMRPDTKNWEWSIKIIDDPETVNAWAMAGGKMALYTGLVQKIRPTDDELAEVLGHEIAHALAKHTAEKMSVAMASQFGVLAVGVAAKNKGVALTGAAAAAALAVQLPNSRVAESEADRIGIELAAKAGYDPRAAVTLWQKMANVGGKGPPEFLSTHPGPENRQTELTARVPQMMAYYQQKGKRPVYRL